MAYEFTKLGDVTLTDSPVNEANVIIEENGEIKKTPKSAIGAQADWNEIDENSPAFILNKPTNLGGGSNGGSGSGGYKYYFYSSYYLYRMNNHTDKPTSFTTGNAVSQSAFEADYYSGPIMLSTDDNTAGKNLIIGYSDYSNDIAYMPMYSSSIVQQELKWGTAN